ncbi:Aldehyde dehydrogenase [Mycena kentingensis (nom. inval.)]|nr:Aldehyde dehydrogenase [Mycena kentingensis (nom. inval.)]
MKRGFLKTPKATKSPLGSSLAAATTAANTNKRIGSEPEVAMPLPFEKFGQKVEHLQDAPKNHCSSTMTWRTVQPDEKVSPTGYDVCLTRIPAYEDNVNNEPTTECMFLDGVKEMLYGTIPDFPRPLPRQPYSKPAFRLAEASGKGLGLFSTRAFKQGDVILVERPLLVTPKTITGRAYMPSDYGEEQAFQYLRKESQSVYARIVESMEPKRKAAFLALFNSHPEDGSGPLLGRIETNGMRVTLGGEDDLASAHIATCEFISRLNHSCSPNTQPKFSLESFSYTLYAVRDIAKGDELTFQYTDVMKSKIERNEELSPRGFECSCIACTDPTSDARRALIQMFTPTVTAWAANDTLRDDTSKHVKKCIETVELIEAEGLEHANEYCAAIGMLLKSYIALGDAEGASKWAKRLGAIPWAPKLLLEVFDKARMEAIAKSSLGAGEKDASVRCARVDENTPEAKAQMLELLAELAGPDGITTLESREEMFKVKAPAPGSDLEKRYKEFLNRQGLDHMMAGLKM